MLRSVAFAAVVASAAAFSPAAVPTLRANTAVCANKFGQSAPAGAPPADLFNIWRDDYMLTPAQAAAEEAERSRNAFFDGVLPPFSNIGNTERGTTPDAPTLRGIGVKADFSTANPTSAIDTGECEEHHHQRGEEEACREENHLRHEREPSDTADSKR